VGSRRKISNPPVSENLFKSAQSQGGYTLAAALADLIDNSISAGAEKIVIQIPVEKGPHELTVTIWDDGEGMEPMSLVDAMRPASKNPSAARDKSDLGRFGWGLKSASLSQAERLEVLTQKNSRRSFAAWDLADCKNFEMEFEEDTSQEPFTSLEGAASWTEVTWKSCSRLSEGYSLNQTQCADKVKDAVRDLELIFHRYLAGDDGLETVTILVNGRALKPNDPFLVGKSSVLTERTKLPFRGDNIFYQAYALPSLSSMTDDEYNRLSGSEGLIKRQGFYVYRNKRLIISGTWFNVESFKPLNQLVRIQLDIPNSMDEIWQITVDKSGAQLPQDLRTYLKDIVRSLRGHSVRKLTHRSPRRQGSEDQLWRLSKKAGMKTFEINHHAQVFQRELFSQDEVLAILKILEASLPVGLIAQTKADSISQVAPERGASEVIYSKYLELLLPTKDRWTEQELCSAMLRYVLIPGDEELIRSLVRKRVMEIGNG